MEIVEFEVNGQKYLSGKLTAIKAWHVARRLGPVFAKAGPTLEKLLAHQNDAGGSWLDQLELFQPLLEAFQEMSDEDSEYVIYSCLKVVKREVNGKWAAVCTSGGALMYEDIELPHMLTLTFRTLEANLSGFISGLGSVSSDTPPAA